MDVKKNVDIFSEYLKVLLFMIFYFLFIMQCIFTNIFIWFVICYMC